MKILHRYILSQVVRNFGLTLAAFTMLFLLFDLFDRIDNILPQHPPLWSVLSFFLLKVPEIVGLMLPIATLAAVLLTIGLLSRQSEITAMRAAGIKLSWILKPIFLFGAGVTLSSLVLNEVIIPFSVRRSTEIYNIDIRGKNRSGAYSRDNIWWRDQKGFYSAESFDSRNDTLHNLSRFELNSEMQVMKRTDAELVRYLAPDLGWSMRQVNEYYFQIDGKIEERSSRTLPLPIVDPPETFYDSTTDPRSMSFRQLRRYIKKQANIGISFSSYHADLWEKLAFPFINLILIPVVAPFAIRSSRGGSIAPGIIAAMGIGFSYYVVHSLSLALGRAELWPALLSAWMANLVLGLVGLIISMGNESA